MSDLRATPDLSIAAIADRQHGVVSTGQLHGIGLDRNRILYRTKVGRLHHVHRGVYAVGHRGLSFHGRLMAATLACGDGATVSHRSAAHLWGLLASRPGPVEISVQGHGGRRKRAGIRIHRSSTLTPSQTTVRNGIPVTTAARTVSDLEHVVSASELRQAVRQADADGRQIGLDLASDDTRSELEFLFIELCRKQGIPDPHVNVQVGPYVVDFIWPAQRLIVETDGYRFHRGRTVFEADRARDLELRALGYSVIRLTYRQVVDRPKETASAIKRTLGHMAQSSDIVRALRPNAG